MRAWQLVVPLLLALAPSAEAADDAVVSGLPRRVVADQCVVLSWSNLPAGARELEFELSLDGTHWVRISPQLDATERAWQWKVPDLPAERAWIRLRVGDDDREVVATKSEAFRIVGSSLAEDARRVSPIEWWRLLDPPGDRPPAALAVDLPALSAMAVSSHAEVVSGLVLRAPACAGRVPLEARGPAPDLVIPVPQSAAPEFIPLRN